MWILWITVAIILCFYVSLQVNPSYIRKNVNFWSISPSTTNCRNQLQKWTLLASLRDCKACVDYCCFIGNCVALLTLDFDIPISWARCFSDFLGVCSSLAPMSCNFFSVSTRRFALRRAQLHEWVSEWVYYHSHCSKFIHQIVNCLCAGNSFITKFVSKFSPALPSRSAFHIGVIQEYTLL
jgi:hypothetical protein